MTTALTMAKDLEVSCDGQIVMFRTVKFQTEICFEVVAFDGKIYVEVNHATLLVEPRDTNKIVIHIQE